MLVVQVATVLSLEAKSRLLEWVVLGRGPAAGEMTSLLAATLGASSGVAAGLMDFGGLGVALPCASAKRSRLLPEVFDDCSSASRGLSS